MAMTPTPSGMAAVASCSTGAFVYECPASAGACNGTALWAASPAPSPAPATDLLLASWDSTSSKVVVIGSFRDFSPSPPLQTVKASTIALAPSPPGPTWTQNTGTVSQISGSFDPSWWSNPRSIKASNGKMYAAGSTELASTKTASLARCEADGTSCAIIDVYAVASRAARGKTGTRVGLVDDVTNSQILVVALDDESGAREVELFSVSYDLATATFLGSLRPAGVTHTEFSEVTPIIDTGNSTLYVMVSGASDLYVYRTTLTGTVIGVDDAVAKVSPAPSPAIRVDSARGQVVNGKLVMVTVDDTTNKPGVFVCELDVSNCTYDAYTGSETVSSSARKTEVVFDVASLTIHAFAAAGSGPALHRYAITAVGFLVIVGLVAVLVVVLQRRKASKGNDDAEKAGGSKRRKRRSAGAKISRKSKSGSTNRRRRSTEPKSTPDASTDASDKSLEPSASSASLSADSSLVETTSS
ncbi:uncharacterized protein AMSG_03366 [Thecamonas trahens ATCC 50062]|uniref:Uncharacterized protein n=1 Tax=Thecamonas trahens ATCC 50062 TaxID=461836 RepID=A0A0L0D3Q7_THETB|nr:hypothetical protein AMSG_03366 [Thecamonas trahens ATCC 50062]KNC46934.1 hypothetical protein AMSG_03366 [Thecamonas trahens ATCC 50062]|eukprot:XP_013760206.1 hypothetical protein AMSG_03366 [Thecamonas trahens ATCC 50062]